MKQDYIKCPFCLNSEQSYHKSGIQSHFKAVHKQSWSEYNQKKLNKKCKICGKKLLKENQTFCSHKCMSIYGASQVKTHRNKYSENTAQKQFEKIDIEIKKEICRTYVESDISIKSLEEKFNFKRELINLILKEQGVKIKKNQHVIEIKKNNQQKFEELAKSDIVKKIIEDYKNPVESFRSLEKKYYLTHHISRNDIRKILKFYNIPYKDANELRKKVWEDKISKGIRHPNFCKNILYEHPCAYWYFYKGTHYQGSFEFKFGLWLESQNIKYLCHNGVKVFKYTNVQGRITSYHPDFYLPETNEYIEVKGYFSDENKEKMRRVIQDNPDFIFKIYTGDILQSLGVFDIDKKLNLNIEIFRYNLKERKFYIKELIKKISRESFLRQSICEQKGILEISKELKEDIHLVNLLYHIYKIPRIGSKQYNKLRLKFIIEKYGKQIKDDYINNLLTQREIIKKYKLSKYFVPSLLKSLDVKKYFSQVDQIRKNRLIDSKYLHLHTQIIELYKIKTETISSISRKLKICKIQVKNILNINNVKLRSIEESKQLRAQKVKEINDKKDSQVLKEQKNKKNLLLRCLIKVMEIKLWQRI